MKLTVPQNTNGIKAIYIFRIQQCAFVLKNEKMAHMKDDCKF